MIDIKTVIIKWFYRIFKSC